MVDIYQATFQCTGEQLSRARADYLDRYGPKSWDDIIAPYIKHGIEYIWMSPKSEEFYWFVDHLARNLAAELDEPYNMPPQFLAVDLTPEPTVECKSCGLVIPEKFTFGDGLCQVCNYRETQAKVDEYTEQFK